MNEVNDAKKDKLYEDIVEQFLVRIKTGSLNPGDRLPPERVLAEEFDVSRTAIREALRSLEMMGCIESFVGKGTYIRSPSLSNIVDPFSMVFAQDNLLNDELIEVRLILETEIARLAALRRSDEHLLALKTAVDDLKRDIEEGGSGIEADAAFHSALAHAAGNQALNTLLEMCSEMLSRTRQITQRMYGVPKNTLMHHEAIYKAVAAKDEKSARRLMRKHLTVARRNLSKLNAKLSEGDAKAAIVLKK